MKKKTGISFLIFIALAIIACTKTGIKNTNANTGIVTDTKASNLDTIMLRSQGMDY